MILSEVLDKIQGPERVRIYRDKELLYDGYCGSIHYAGLPMKDMEVTNIRIATQIMKRKKYQGRVPVVEDRTVAESCLVGELHFTDMDVNVYLCIVVY